MQGSYLGPGYDDDEIGAFLAANGYPAERLSDDEWPAVLAGLDRRPKVLGLCQGRMEFGPRALGNRSIVGDARSPKMQSVMNLKIKFRESFRPFAPIVLSERTSDWFETNRPSRYMLVVSEVKESKRKNMTETENQRFGIDKLNIPRSEIPAVTHIDYSARVQTVHSETNPRLHRLLGVFEKKTGCPVLVNTSFNVRGEPIVCTPEDAYKCFMRT